MDSLKALNRQIVAHIRAEFEEGRRLGYPRIMAPWEELYVVIGRDTYELDPDECEALVNLLTAEGFSTSSASSYRDMLVRNLRSHIAKICGKI